MRTSASSTPGSGIGRSWICRVPSVEPGCLHVDASLVASWVQARDHATTRGGAARLPIAQLPTGPTAAISYCWMSADRTGTTSGFSGCGARIRVRCGARCSLLSHRSYR